jgi:tRNA pseudouridine38-40 synthase
VTRYFLFLSFKGTAYNGWQLQPGRATVQGIVNKALTTILGEEINVTGAGRTDTGVHASFFCCHFDSQKNSLDNNQQLLYRLNGFLPGDISFTKIAKVKVEANARFDAVSRTYCYTILKVKDPFFTDTGWLLFWALDIKKMNEAAALLLKHNDFTSFCRLHGGNKTNLCKISLANWTETEKTLLFTITADRFLRNMVRAITGTMIPVGRGKLSPEEFELIIQGKNRGLAGQSAPAQGLTLTAIEYPKEIFI